MKGLKNVKKSGISNCKINKVCNFYKIIIFCAILSFSMQHKIWMYSWKRFWVLTHGYLIKNWHWDYKIRPKIKNPNALVSEKHQESMTLTKYKQGKKNVQYKSKCMISLWNSPTSLSMATSRTANYISKDSSGKGDKNKGSHLLWWNW